MMGMDPAERDLCVARERYLRALREHLRELHHKCAECTFRLVIVEGREEILACKHGQILGPDDKIEIWG